METIGERLAKVPSPRGFNYLRIGLALVVVLGHSHILTYTGAGHPYRDSALAPFLLSVIPMFFALGGFLIAASLERSRTVAGFLTLRTLRIFPALAVEIVLSALILGPLVTTVPLSDYFTDPLFARYFLNILGDPQYHLPGVFTGNRVPSVNQQLWTLPWDLVGYGGVALLGAIGAARNRMVIPAITLACVIGVCLLELILPANGAWTRIGRGLLFACFAGVSVYQLRYLLPRSGVLAAVCAVLGGWLVTTPWAMALSAFPIAYATVWLGLLDPPASPLAGEADYSYGLYLFSYPIQQWLWLWPPLRVAWLNALVALPIVLLFAAGSWHFVEGPMLRRKRAVVAWVEALTARILGRPHAPPGKPLSRDDLTEPLPPRQ